MGRFIRLGEKSVNTNAERIVGKREWYASRTAIPIFLVQSNTHALVTLIFFTALHFPYNFVPLSRT